MYQIVETTHDEKMKMYMKCTKVELAKMLIECNRQLTATLEAKNLQQYAVIGSCQHLWVKDNSTTSIREYCQLCGTPKYVGNLL